MRRIIIVCCALVAALLPAVPPSAAQTACLPSGGVPLARAAPAEGDFVLFGGGWGHGAGMSQYGAHGAALLGCDAATIAQTYYPGVQVAPAAQLPERFRVSLWPDRPGGSPITAFCIRAHTGNPVWQLPGEQTLEQPQGPYWRIDHTGDGALRFRQIGGRDECRNAIEGAGEVVWEGATSGDVLRLPLDGDPIVQLSSKSTNSQWGDGRPYAHGTMELRSVASGFHVIVELATHDGVNALERYLRGLAEMPSSWHGEALKAQAITGRSYALVKSEDFAGGRPGCFCDVFDSVYDQVYNGYLKESEGDQAAFGSRWVAAVNATAGQVLTYEESPGQTVTVSGFYSSSHGGHSESSHFVFGGPETPYLQPVDDSRWEAALRDSDSGGKNPNLRWSTGLSRQQVAAALDQNDLGVGEVRTVTLPDPKGAAGRVGRVSLGYGGVRIVGSLRERTIDGDTFRRILGLRSTLFEVVTATEVDTSCVPTGAAVDEEAVDRVSGPERIATALAVSQRDWTSAPDVLLATSRDYPDALASGSLAATLDAPLLLTQPDDLPDAVRAELDRLDARTVWILGGGKAVSAAVEDELDGLGLETRRVAGATRIETAQQIAFSPSAATRPVVALVMAEDWPAAVAAGALAASPDRIPTLLTQPDTLPAPTRSALEELQATEVLVIGGTTAVSEAVVEELRELGYTVERLAGDTRYHTSRVVAEEALSRSTDEATRPVVLATGKDFPDALTAGALAARLSGALVLAPPCALADAPPTREFLEANRTRLRPAVIVGGTAAVSQRVMEDVAAVLGD